MERLSDSNLHVGIPGPVWLEKELWESIIDGFTTASTTLKPRWKGRAKMTQTKTICDRCGKEINGQYPRFKLCQKNRRLDIIRFWGSGGYDYVSYDYDICDECNKELEKWLGQK